MPDIIRPTCGDIFDLTSETLFKHILSFNKFEQMKQFSNGYT